MNTNEFKQIQKENTYHNKQIRIKKLFPIIKKRFGKDISPIEATRILEDYTNIWDSDENIKQQLKLAIDEGKIVINKEQQE